MQISISDLNIRKGPGTNYATTGKFTGKGVFTIVETKQGTGSAKGWGKLNSGAGWIALDYATTISLTILKAIAGDIKLSPATVKRSIKDLRKDGLIEAKQRYREQGGKSSLFYKLKHW